MALLGRVVSVLWRACNVLIATFFAVAALVQVIYTVPAVLTLLVALNPLITDNLIWKSISAVLAFICVVWAAHLAHFLMLHTHWYIYYEEEGRQLFGLVLIVAWMSLCHSFSRNPIGGKIRMAVASVTAILPFIAWLYLHVNQEFHAFLRAICKSST